MDAYQILGKIKGSLTAIPKEPDSAIKDNGSAKVLADAPSRTTKIKIAVMILGEN